MISNWTELEGLVQYRLPRKTLVSVPDYGGIHPVIDFNRDVVRERGGIKAQALYSYTMEAWSKDSELVRQEFPFTAITAEHFEIDRGWTMQSAALRLVRDARLDLMEGNSWIHAECARRVYIFSRIRLMGVFFDLKSREAYPERYSWTDHEGNVRPWRDTLARDRIFFSEEGAPFLSWDEFQVLARDEGWLQIWEEAEAEANRPNYQ